MNILRQSEQTSPLPKNIISTMLISANLQKRAPRLLYFADWHDHAKITLFLEANVLPITFLYYESAGINLNAR